MKSTSVASSSRDSNRLSLVYQETFSPTPAGASIRMVLAIAAVEDWELRHLDVEQAFLETDIDKEIYTELPEEYQDVDCIALEAFLI